MYHTDLRRFRFALPLGRAEETRTIRRAKAGDAEAMTLIHDRFQLLLVRTCSKLAGGWMKGDDADDILSEANLALVRAVHSFTPRRKARFATWLFIVVRRYVLAYLAKRTKLAGPDKAGTSSLSSGDPASRFSEMEPSWAAGLGELAIPGADAEKQETLERMKRTIARWPRRDRQLFTKRVVEGLTFDELAAYLPPGGPGGRREAAPRFRKLLQRLRSEVLR